MTNNYAPQLKALAFFSFFTFLYFQVSAQVGIGTTNPNANALLDLDASTTPGGLLLPRVSLDGTNSFAPLTANVAGMVIYNTATAGVAPNNVIPGYYYNDGAGWVRIAAASVPSSDWTLTGNTGTDVNNNFVGTTDNESLRFRTRDIERFEITDGTNNNNNGGGRLQAFFNGTAALPTYSWNSNAGTGMFQQAANVIGFSTNTTERFRIPNADQVHAMTDGSAAVPFYSWGTDVDTGMYRIAANTLGFATNGNERIRITNTQILVGSNGTEAAPLYSWNGDANTGIFNPVADNLGLSTNGTEKVRIIANGDVGVGTPGPIAKLHVSLAQNDRPGVYSQITATNSIYPSGEFYNPNTGGGIGIQGNGYYGIYGATTNLFLGYAGYFAGDVRTRDIYYRNAYSYSDRRVKQNFQNIDNGLQLIMKLKPKKYEKLVQTDNSSTLSDLSSVGVMGQMEKAEKEFGLIAQDVELILPELVSSKKSNLKDLGTIDLKAVNYNGLIPILIQAMQEQQSQISALQEEVKTLKTKN